MTTDSQIDGENWDDSSPQSNGVVSGQNGFSRVINNNGENGVRRSHNRKRNGFHKNNFTHMPSIVGEFKEVPTVRINVSRRPFMGRCCTCLPQSRNEHYHADMESKGLSNILAIKGQKKVGILSGTWQFLTHGWKKAASFTYANVTNDVLISATLTEAIQKTVLEQNDIEDVEALSDSEWAKLSVPCKKYARKMLGNMQAYLSNSFVRFVAWFLHKIFRQLVSSISVHRGQMNMISNVCKNKDLPVIFLPNHSSHLDYILVTFILQHYHIRPPHVAAGENLNLPFVGMRLRALGGYFIRRRIDGKRRGQKDYVYRAVLQTYMQELLRHNENFEFFVEGGRSRSGKPLYPKGGLLSAIVQSYLDETIPDAYIVPVSFSYDRLMDGNFMSEQQGHAKKPESLWRMAVSMFRILRGFYGQIRVNFTQPFSLKEYMRVSQFFEYNTSSQLLQLPPVDVLDGIGNDDISNKPSPDTPSDVSVLSSRDNSPSERRMMPSISSSCSLINSDCNSDDVRNTVHGLAVHVVHSFTSQQALMATHVVSFLLLNKYRDGVSMEEFTNGFKMLLLELSMRNRDVGFSSDADTVIKYALKILGPKLVKVTKKNKSIKPEDVMLHPVVNLPYVIELSYYSNSVACVFSLESVVALSLNSLIVQDIWKMHGHDSRVNVSRANLIHKATDLCNILQHDFIFKPPCKSWDSVIMDAIDQFLASDILITEEADFSSYGYRSSAAKRNARYWGRDIEHDDDYEYEDDVNYLLNITNKESIEKLKRLQAVLSPYLEAYYFVASRMVSLVGKNYTEVEFVKMVHKALKKRIKQKLVYYTECVCVDIVRNAVSNLLHLGFIDKYTPTGGKEKYPEPILRLRGNDIQQVEKFIAIIQSYQTHIDIH